MASTGVEDDKSPIVSELARSPKLSEAASVFAHRLLHDIELLRGALRTRDERTLLEIAHRLIGAGGINGYPCISRSALLLEQAVKDGGLKAAGAFVEQLAGLQVRMQAGVQGDVRTRP